ncbi:hypothetical protein [Blastococcus tunisiensis]|uniref:Uncharacterized protein n=1 Tax=Blastococcus tunisiensis TaxID=1798228 RepID=A0A1I2JU54_9ACTN|nr:hypothetical protein [Blastococcus sp. DSM 46838]SFF58345.1 hypothetical protein SAMN05216574_11818 [Blastococcus sp. DSM 46838]
MNAASSSGVVVGGAVRQGWWLVDEEAGSGRIVAGPYPDRADAVWAADALENPSHEEPAHQGQVRPVYGVRRPDGGLGRRPSPQDWAWLGHLGEQLDRLPEDWDAGFPDDDPLATFVVEVTAALAEAGLQLHEPTGDGRAVGGVCLSPEPGLGGIVLTWRQHDRMSVEQLPGSAAQELVQQVMNRALADVLRLRGFEVGEFAGGTAHVVRPAA